MKRIDNLKMAIIIYNNYADRMRTQKIQAAREVGLFFAVDDKTVIL